MQNTRQSQYTITLDDETQKLIQQTIALEKEQLQTDPHSAKYFELKAEIQDLMHDIAWSIIYDYKNAPF